MERGCLNQGECFLLLKVRLLCFKWKNIVTNILISSLRILFTTGYLRGYSYAALWYLSILLGFYFLYAPLLPLLLLNRSDQTIEYFILISWLLQKMVSEVHGHPVRHLGGLQRLPARARIRGRTHSDRRSNPSP